MLFGNIVSFYMNICLLHEKIKKAKMVKPFLKKGFYQLQLNSNEIKRVPLFKYLFSLLKKSIPLRGTKNGLYDAGHFNSGYHKAVFLVEDKAIIIYEKETEFLSYLKEHQNLEWLIYKHPKDLSWNYKLRAIIQERCTGENLNKYILDFDELYRCLFYFACNTNNKFYLEKNISLFNKELSIKYSYQEGDLAPCNIIKGTFDYYVIDFDNSTFYPVGYDFFFFLFLKTEESIFKAFFSSKENSIDPIFSSLFSAFSINYNKENFEKYLAAFIVDCISEKNLYNRYKFRDIISKRIVTLKEYGFISEFALNYFKKLLNTL